MNYKRADFINRVDKAIADYMDGDTQSAASERYGIAASTIGRHMRQRGLKLSREELRARRQQAGKTTQRLYRDRVLHNSPCPAGCTCGKHKPNTNNLKNPVILGRKNCSKCYRWRSILDFYVRDRDEDDNPLGFQTTCKICTGEITRRNQGIRRRGKPYQKRKPPLSEEERRAKRRELHRWKMENVPGYAEDRREYHRIYAEGKRREAGVPRRDAMIEKRNVGGAKGDPKLPLVPFQQWIKERSAHYARVEGIEARGEEVAGIGHLAYLCGVSERLLRRHINGYEIDRDGRRREITHVALSTVDKCLTNEGTTLIWELYPGNDDSSYVLDTDDLDLELAGELILAA